MAVGWFNVPTISFPVFNNPLTMTVLVGVGVMAIATIPESTAHLYQISLYVDHLADEIGTRETRSGQIHRLEPDARWFG